LRISDRTGTKTMRQSRLRFEGAADLEEKLAHFSATERRDLGLRASRLAVEHARINDPLIDLALEKIEGGDVEDEIFRARLRQLVDSLDDEYLDINDEDEDDRLHAFRKARAANAVLFCFDPDSIHGSAEAIYEASHALRDMRQLRELLGI